MLIKVIISATIIIFLSWCPGLSRRVRYVEIEALLFLFVLCEFFHFFFVFYYWDYYILWMIFSWKSEIQSDQTQKELNEVKFSVPANFFIIFHISGGVYLDSCNNSFLYFKIFCSSLILKAKLRLIQRGLQARFSNFFFLFSWSSRFLLEQVLTAGSRVSSQRCGFSAKAVSIGWNSVFFFVIIDRIEFSFR